MQQNESSHRVTEVGIEPVGQLRDSSSDFVEVHRLLPPISLQDIHSCDLKLGARARCVLPQALCVNAERCSTSVQTANANLMSVIDTLCEFMRPTRQDLNATQRLSETASRDPDHSQTMADAAEFSPVKKQKVKKNKDTVPATEPKKKSKRKSVDAGDAPNTAPEASRKKKKKEVQPEEAASPVDGSDPKKKKRRAAEAAEAVGPAPEQAREPEASGADADSAEDGRQNGPTKKPKTQAAEAAPGPEEGKQGKKRKRCAVFFSRIVS